MIIISTRFQNNIGVSIVCFASYSWPRYVLMLYVFTIKYGCLKMAINNTQNMWERLCIDEQVQFYDYSNLYVSITQ